MSAPIGQPKPLTTHADDTVRRARISGNGEWIVYECGADLWVVSTKGDGSPRKLAIEVNADDKSNTERSITYTRDATEFALSPDEDHAVIAVHGRTLPDEGPRRRQGDATHGTSPSTDSNPTWSARRQEDPLRFRPQRQRWTCTSLEPDDPEHPELTRAHKFKTKRLTNTPEAEIGATFSPKGDRIAFVRDGKLWTMKPDGTDQKVLVDEQKVFDYDWSPDGKHDRRIAAWMARSRRKSTSRRPTAPACR